MGVVVVNLCTRGGKQGKRGANIDCHTSYKGCLDEVRRDEGDTGDVASSVARTLRSVSEPVVHSSAAIPQLLSAFSGC